MSILLLQKNNLKTVFLSLTAIWAVGCQDLKTEAGQSGTERRQLSSEFEDYWYAGEAEITSYELSQPRYGELRQGNVVLIFVTEDFLPEVQVKADQPDESTVTVMKLNATKKYTTGIYPYSIMTSTFYPVYKKEHAIKVSNSAQEWCGHVYSQINNRDQFEVTSHSYFEGEADQNFKLSKDILEDELWTQLRLDPSGLPVGEKNVIPALEYIRLKHKEFKAYPARMTKTDTSYTIEYPELNRKLVINFDPSFPFEIRGWNESFPSGFGENAEIMTSTAKKITTIRTPYWKQNSEKFNFLRDSLGL